MEITGSSNGETKVKAQVPMSGLHSESLANYTIRAASSKRMSKRFNADHDHSASEHGWIFQFIDIIYVGTVYNISHMFTRCGPGTYVYILCFAYFVIMFSSRHSFDVYNCISGASGALHLVAFCLYGCGVFIMTVNIYADVNHDTGTSSHVENITNSYVNTGSYGDHHYGKCFHSIDHDIGFAFAFIATRIVLIIMYLLYFNIFHENNLLGHSPDIGTRISNADLRDTALEMSTIIVNNNSDLSNEHNPIHLPTFSSGNEAEEIIRNIHYIHRESIVKKHFHNICILKITPAIINSLLMLAIPFGIAPIIILPIVAGIEFLSDFLTSFLVNNNIDWKELTLHRHLAQERLGLFFMLVLGEGVLGLAVALMLGQIGKINYGQMYTVLL